MGQKVGKPNPRVRSKSLPLAGYDGDSSSTDESDAEVVLRKQKKNSKKFKKSKKKMPLFRKQSEQARKRSDHQQYLAKEDPEPTFDLSHCEHEEIPTGVFALCRVLQKEVLLLNDNWLRSVDDTGNVGDLKSIRVLDLHNNELRSLPNKFGDLTNLQVLNLENNKMSQLPDTLGQLSHLQTLNLKGNRLRELPHLLCSLRSLRLLDISDNQITALPQQLCNVRTLETLTLDAQGMIYPPNDICDSGTEEIMKFLCSECGMEYLPPSNFLLNVLDPPKHHGSRSPNKALQHENMLAKHIEGYSSMMERKRQERIELERKFAEHQEEQAQLALMAMENRQKLIMAIAVEETKLETELDKLASEKERDRQRLVRDLQEVEQGADVLVARLLEMNANARKTEELLDQIEEERIRDDEIFVVRWEEIENLRKKEVLDAMEKTLHEFEVFEAARQIFSDEKETTLQRAMEEDNMMAHAQIQSVLIDNEQQQNMLVNDLARQERLQKEAFEALQLQKDAKNQRINGQIALIQDELAQLTVVEIERREFRQEEEIMRLAEKRITLIELLSQLMFEQDCRQTELKRRLEEMEQQRLDGQTDYWLVQYQRLMDQKPQSLIDQERQLEICIVKILQKSSAEDYMPLFARHRISIETLLQMTDGDLKQEICIVKILQKSSAEDYMPSFARHRIIIEKLLQRAVLGMGVHEMGLRRDILRNLEEYRSETAAAEPPPCTSLASDYSNLAPTAPPLEDDSPTRQTSVTARGLNSECSICLDRMSEVIFLNCGHVCCCILCSDLIQQCPLCRCDVIRRIKLLPPSLT